jgi:hypothetical protein
MRLSPLRGTRNHYGFLYGFSPLIWEVRPYIAPHRVTERDNPLKSSGPRLVIFRADAKKRPVQVDLHVLVDLCVCVPR